MSRGPLCGKHALVTGGSSGIGLAIARRIGAEGARITILARDTERLADAEAKIDGVHALRADVTDAKAVAAAVERARGDQGPVLVLVNCAGAAESAPFDKTDAALWQRMLDVNLSASFHCTRAALADMKQAGFGRIVNIGSTASVKGYRYVSAYCAAKHGLIGLTRSLALELATTGVTVNAVCPGYTDTPLVDRAVEGIARKTGRSEVETRAELVGDNPMGRLIDPDEVAAAVAWLCLPESGTVTGQAIAVAGGEVM